MRLAVQDVARGRPAPEAVAFEPWTLPAHADEARHALVHLHWLNGGWVHRGGLPDDMLFACQRRVLDAKLCAGDADHPLRCSREGKLFVNEVVDVCDPKCPPAELRRVMCK